ncbi:MAG: hypothetical protein PSN34_11770 [Urechidicola sp.]|nr:hypothetical protein [Urechidicola sp.]
MNINFSESPVDKPIDFYFNCIRVNLGFQVVSATYWFNQHPIGDSMNVGASKY